MCYMNVIRKYNCYAGELDHDTRHTMSLPRCGVQDVVGQSSGSRRRRYALQGRYSGIYVSNKEFIRCPTMWDEMKT